MHLLYRPMCARTHTHKENTKLDIRVMEIVDIMVSV